MSTQNDRSKGKKGVVRPGAARAGDTWECAGPFIAGSSLSGASEKGGGGDGRGEARLEEAAAEKEKGDEGNGKDGAGGFGGAKEKEGGVDGEGGGEGVAQGPRRRPLFVLFGCGVSTARASQDLAFVSLPVHGYVHEL